MSYELYLDDCMKLMKNFPKNSVNLTLTDIPYGVVNRDSNGLRNLDKNKADIPTFQLNDFLHELNRVTSGTIIIFCAKEQFSTIFRFFSELGMCTRAIVWEKTNPSPMNGQYVYLSGIELAVWVKKKGGTFNPHCKNTVFRCPSGRRRFHPTEKNEKLIQELILDNSSPNDKVFDPCMGSGTTGISCIRTGRNFIGIEIDAEYYKTAKLRIETESRDMKEVK